jgi:hypothetical protein
MTFFLLGLASRKFIAEENKDPNEPNQFVANWNFDTSGTHSEEKDTFPDWIQSFNDWPREKKVVALNLAAVGTIAAIGGISWEYGSSSFHIRNEGWFEHDSKYGGADKMGHAFAGYALATIYNHIYKKWGYSEDQALLYGALSSWGQMTLIEVGDSFSGRYGFSWEDDVMDAGGAVFACLRQKYPQLKEMIDYRLEWFPSSNFRQGDQSDPFTDYSGQKYLLAFKPDGFLKTNNFFLKALEMHLGYYTRGYDEENDSSSHRRYTYVGIGLNVTYLLDQLTGHDAWKIFDYLQMPYTYVSSSSEFN